MKNIKGVPIQDPFNDSICLISPGCGDPTSKGLRNSGASRLGVSMASLVVLLEA